MKILRCVQKRHKANVRGRVTAYKVNGKIQVIVICTERLLIVKSNVDDSWLH